MESLSSQCEAGVDPQRIARREKETSLSVMPGNWKRPESVPYPSVWSRFEGKREIDGKKPKFWIQDIPEDMFEEAVEIMCKSFILEEPLCKYSNVTEDELSVQEIKETWRVALKDKVAIICFMENPDPNGKPIVAGLNMTFISVKDEPIPEFKGKKWSKVISSVMYLTHVKDPYEELGINVYLSALGLSVLPQFRGQGIGDALLLARTPLCMALGLKATLTVFTATASQKLAVRTGFKDITALSYEELERRNPQFRYPGIQEHTKDIRYMYKMF